MPPTGPPTPFPAASVLPSRTNLYLPQRQGSSEMSGGMLLGVGGSEDENGDDSDGGRQEGEEGERLMPSRMA